MAFEIVGAIIGTTYLGAKAIWGTLWEKNCDRQLELEQEARDSYYDRFNSRFVDPYLTREYTRRMFEDRRYAMCLLDEVNETLKEELPGVPHDFRYRYLGSADNRLFRLITLVHFTNLGVVYSPGSIGGGEFPLDMRPDQAEIVIRWARDKLRKKMPDCEVYKFIVAGRPYYGWHSTCWGTNGVKLS